MKLENLVKFCVQFDNTHIPLQLLQSGLSQTYEFVQLLIPPTALEILRYLAFFAATIHYGPVVSVRGGCAILHDLKIVLLNNLRAVITESHVRKVVS